MACNRGCVGTSINNATNVCGVQISHNCSPGCSGLASGQSRLQVNAAGELVLCSNVGGTCECVELRDPIMNRVAGGGASGSNTIQLDTDGDGTADFEFCEGFCNLVTDNTCADGGIGVDYAVREVTFNGDTLTINGAPEHTSVTSVAPRFAAIPGPGHPSVSPLQELVMGQTDLTLTNPSLCREMAVTVTLQSKIDLIQMDTVAPGGTYTSRAVIDSSIGGVFVSRLGAKYDSPWPAGVAREGRQDTITWVEIIPAGASVTYTGFARLIADVAGFPVPATEVVIQMHAIGTTV